MRIKITSRYFRAFIHNIYHVYMNAHTHSQSDTRARAYIHAHAKRVHA